MTNQLRRLSKSIFLLLGSGLGALVLMIPMQHYMTLSRYQHYGMAVFVFGLGYALHCIWTWRKQPFWSRLCYALTGAFFTSVGLLFYANPWMDWKTSVQTESNQILRFALSGLYLVLGFILMIVWLIAYIKKNPAKQTK